MGQNYGNSLAQKLIDAGQFDQAIAEATRIADLDDTDPEPLVDRAAALVSLSRYAEAARDLENALKLDVEIQQLETDFVDDALFSALLADSRLLKDSTQAIARLGHYRDVLPAGRHAADVDLWTRRLRGDDKDAVIVKDSL